VETYRSEPWFTDMCHRLGLLVWLTAALWGCASSGVTPPSPVPEKVVGEASPVGWWYARFAINWPEGAEPSWYLDPLLAHQVIAPVLQHHREELKLWRFHRRAARDQAGHQFSFIFYAGPDAARRVFTALQADPLLGELKQRGLVLQSACDEPDTVTRPNLEDTSDRHWPLSVQRSWPYYIQGVSEMWLNLIAEIASQPTSGKPPAGLDELLHFYEQLNRVITQLWRQEGHHAFLHHLNALFGYEPLMVRERRPMNF